MTRRCSVCQWLIPAHAGKTPRRSSSTSSNWAHPRSRGENAVDLPRGSAIAGSSPLTRGKHDARQGRQRDRGLIPAHAGKTCPGNRSTRTTRAHPRSRGENHPRGRESTARCGSSPLTRGKLLEAADNRRLQGLIPAHAGKTPLRNKACAGEGAHPRSRGENELSVRRCASGEGSSPLTRGKLVVREKSVGRLGLIPAHAGKTSMSMWSPRCGGAHPRSRGENIKAAVSVVVEWGSSPLTRGKPPTKLSFVLMRGLIPAHAGKTA